MPEYISFLLLHNKLPPPKKLSSLKQKEAFIISNSFCGSGIQGQLSWVVLAWELSWACSQDVSRGCSHLKAWLGLEGPPPRGLTNMLAVDAWGWQEASVPPHIDLSLGLFESPHYMKAIDDPGESKAEAAMTSMTFLHNILLVTQVNPI